MNAGPSVNTTHQANIEVHTRLADVYNATEPHYRPENRKKVRSIIERLHGQNRGGRLLDLGCGTGFIIDLTHDLFDAVDGVDITEAMLAKVDLTRGNITLHRAPAEQLPFDSGYFDMVTAYSFIHHTEDYLVVLREAFRVLKPGGIFYIDLEPNKLFWDALSALPPDDVLSPIIQKAKSSVTETDSQMESKYGIPRKTFQQAEFGKAVLGGIDPRAIAGEAERIGYSEVSVRVDWYVGQADVMHGQSFEAAELIEGFLRSIAPLSDHLFKYVQLILRK